MSRSISFRAREQAKNTILNWLYDNLGEPRVRVDSIFVDDFDGTRPQMTRLVIENMESHGFRPETRKGVKWLVRDLSGPTLHVAPDPTNPSAVSGDVLFLAGPIQGAPDWQAEAIRQIQATAPFVHIASPRQPIHSLDDFTDKDYRAQVDWETQWLLRASRKGAIVFWLAKEVEHQCSRSYAQTTRFELGEWMGIRGERVRRVERNDDFPIIVVGIEDGFTGAKYLRSRFPWMTFEKTLERTVDTAIRMTRTSR